MVVLDGKRYLLVHATPRDPMDEYAPPEVNFWAARLARLKVDYLLTGHTHLPYTLQVNNTLVVNPGSVGLARDGDPRAAYAIIEDGTVQLKRAEYPIEETLRAVHALTTDETARAMLCEVYSMGALTNKWLRNGNGVNGHAPDQHGGVTANRASEGTG
jgi:diadenosine tetraphosphatase ApaH/serine/threonine PP2A family protein phosphatase